MAGAVPPAPARAPAGYGRAGATVTFPSAGPDQDDSYGVSGGP